MATKIWNQNITITDPPIAQTLFSNTRWAWLWLIVRLYVGYTWLSRWSKVSKNCSQKRVSAYHSKRTFYEFTEFASG